MCAHPMRAKKWVCCAPDVLYIPLRRTPAALTTLKATLGPAHSFSRLVELVDQKDVRKPMALSEGVDNRAIGLEARPVKVLGRSVLVVV